MKTLLKNGNILTSKGFVIADIIIENSTAKLSEKDSSFLSFDEIIDCTNLYITPGFTDVHVHFREPGFFYKESIQTGSLSAAKEAMLMYVQCLILIRSQVTWKL